MESEQEAQEQRRAHEAGEEERRTQKAQERQVREARARERAKKARERRETQEERESQDREIEAQGGTRVDAQEEREEGEEEKEQKENANSLHEESHVSNRHMTWWQKHMVDPSRERTTLAQRPDRLGTSGKSGPGKKFYLDVVSGAGVYSRNVCPSTAGRRRSSVSRCWLAGRPMWLSLTCTAPSRAGVPCLRTRDVAVMADCDALYDNYHCTVDTERVLITFAPICLFQFRFADTENSYLSPLLSLINWWPSWLTTMTCFWTDDKHVLVVPVRDIYLYERKALKNPALAGFCNDPYQHEIYQRNVREKLQEIEELTSDVIDSGMVPHSMTHPAKSRGEQCIFPCLCQLIAGCKFMACLRKEYWSHGEVDALGSQTGHRQTTSKTAT